MQNNTSNTFDNHNSKQKSMTNNQPIIVGLDIGTTKVVAIAGRKNEFGKLEILGFGEAKSNGVQHGMVLNIDQTIRAIELAMKNCYESNPELDVKEVYVGVAGHHIKSLQTRGDRVRIHTDEVIRQFEIDQLVEDQYKTYIPAGDQIIDVIPQEYTIDNFQNITDPIGRTGVKIGANFHIITGDRNAIKNINRSVESTGLRVKDLMLQPLASSAAVMSEQDIEAGIAILDIGGGTTDLAVFHEGVLKHTAVIPFGGENITNDIKMGLGVLKSHAEQMKLQFGSALADEAHNNAFIKIPGLRGLPSKDISVKNLAGIIQARMSEILAFVTFHLKQVGLDNKMLNGGIVLTGGGSQMKHLIQLTEYVTGLNARIGYPNEHLAGNHIEGMEKPMYATCIGLILKGYSVYEGSLNELKSENSNTLMQTEKLNEKPEEEVVIRMVNKKPKTFKEFMNSIKGGMIDLFKEEGDLKL